MNGVSAIRILHDYTGMLPIPAGPAPDGFSLEAWVRLAPMDTRARLYPESDYAGAALVLRVGRTDSFGAGRLPRLGSIDLPDGVEVVLFGEDNCTGPAWAYRDDVPLLPEGPATARSALVIDRRKPGQHDAVVFADPGYTGAAVVVRAMRTLTVGEQLPQARSAWIPPGLQLECSGPGVGRSIRGDHPNLPIGLVTVAPRLGAQATGDVVYAVAPNGDPHGSKPFGQPDGCPDWLASDVSVGVGYALFLFSELNYAGRCRVVVDAMADLSDLNFRPQSVIFAKATDGVRGVLCGAASGMRGGAIVYPTGYTGPVAPGFGQGCLVPPGFRVRTGDGRTFGPGFHDGCGLGLITVERFAGVLTLDGEGLALTLAPGEITARGDMPRFAGEPVRDDRWHHLAVVWQNGQLRSILDGRDLGTVPAPGLEAGLGKAWTLGEGFRGSIAGLRFQAPARPLEAVKRQRFFGALGAAEPLALDGLVCPPRAVAVAADLPGDPARSAVGLQLVAGARAERQPALDAANVAAQAARQAAEERGRARLAAARERARRELHLASLADVSFVRGSAVAQATWLSAERRFECQAVRFGSMADLVPTDTAWGGADRVVFVACAYPRRAIVRREADGTERVLVDDLPEVPLAIAVATGVIIEGLAEPVAVPYWIEANGVLCVAWPGVGRVPLLGPLPPGRPRSWDIALDVEAGWVYWTNGWELWSARLVGRTLSEPAILVPHALSPHPVAVVVAPDGSVIFVDVEEEEVRILRRRGGTLEGPTRLFAAPAVARGTAAGRVQELDVDAQFAYFVAACEREVLAARVDNPGVVVDLRRSDGPRHPFGQHGPLAVLGRVGATWAPVCRAFRIDQATAYVSPVLAMSPGFEVSMQVRSTCTNRIPIFSVVDQAGALRSIEYTPLEVGDGWGKGLPLLPQGQWCEVSVRFRAGSTSKNVRIDVLYDGVPVLRDWSAMFDLGQAQVQFPAARSTDSSNTGFVRRFSIRPLSGDGFVPIELIPGNAAAEAIPVTELTGGLPAVAESALVFATPDDVLQFEPVYLDPRRGLDVSAELTWKGGEAPQCVFELATDEDEERIALVIEPDGTPGIRVRWGGRLLATSEPSGARPPGAQLAKERPALVGWRLDPDGTITATVHGIEACKFAMKAEFEARVFESVRIGLPAPDQSHVHLRGATLRGDDSPTALAAYRGSVTTLRVVVGAPDAPATAPRAAIGRELMRHRTRLRYLQVGRTDIAELPTPLFPLDLDAGLALETRLTAANVRLGDAHAEAAAAEAYAARLKASSLSAGEAALREATTARDAAIAKAARDVAEAEARRAEEMKRGEERRAQAQRDADQVRAQGATQAAAAQADADARANNLTTVESAAADAQVRDGSRRLGDAQRERDAKKAEVESRR